MTRGREIRVLNSRRHKCAAENCNLEIPLHLLMCLNHWRLVSKPVQRQVWRWYELIKGNPKQDHPSFDSWVQNYEQAVRAAIGCVTLRLNSGNGKP